MPRFNNSWVNFFKTLNIDGVRLEELEVTSLKPVPLAYSGLGIVSGSWMRRQDDAMRNRLQTPRSERKHRIRFSYGRVDNMYRNLFVNVSRNVDAYERGDDHREFEALMATLCHKQGLVESGNY